MKSRKLVAELLRIPRSDLVELLDRGEIPFEPVGPEQRLCFEDVLAYRAARRDAQKEQLDELSRLSQELEGVYR